MRGKPSARRLRWGEDLGAAGIPDEIDDFLRLMAGPTLFELPGQDRSRCRIVSTLLHANEPSGLRAVHRWLRSGTVPVVDARIFIGAVETALIPPGFAHRFAPGAKDLNRCWSPPTRGPEGDLARDVLADLRAAEPECLIDIHNNTGHNPPYGVTPKCGPAEFKLVSLFADRLVHTPLQLGTLVEATQDDFPSATIECGRSGDPVADEVAYKGLERYLGQSQLHLEQCDAAMTLLVDPVRVCMRPDLELAFGEGPNPAVDLTVSRDIDRHNFELLQPGAAIGWLGERGVWPVEARCERGRECSEELFVVRDGVFETRRTLIPIMMTTDRRIALDDCLFYAVQPADGRERK
jgi:hypothetical protein